MTTQGGGTRSTSKLRQLQTEIVSVYVCIIQYERKTVVILSMQAMQTLIINPRNFERDRVSYIDMMIFKCKAL